MSATGVTGLLGWLAVWLPLALAGGAGAACRWSVDACVNRLSGRMSQAISANASTRRRSKGTQARRMPWGTVVVNVTACFLMGLLVGSAGSAPDPGSWVAAAVRVLGTGSWVGTPRSPRPASKGRDCCWRAGGGRLLPTPPS